MRLERTSGYKLQRIRKRWFFEHPLCVHCELLGRVALAVELDHVVPLHKGGADDDSNRQGLCKPCHATKTAEDMGYTQKPSGACDVNGWPTDPRHTWNKR